MIRLGSYFTSCFVITHDKRFSTVSCNVLHTTVWSTCCDIGQVRSLRRASSDEIYVRLSWCPSCHVAGVLTISNSLLGTSSTTSVYCPRWPPYSAVVTTLSNCCVFQSDHRDRTVGIASGVRQPSRHFNAACLPRRRIRASTTRASAGTLLTETSTNVCLLLLAALLLVLLTLLALVACLQFQFLSVFAPVYCILFCCKCARCFIILLIK